MVAENPTTAISRFSTIQTDPLRNFRFRADFSAAGGTVFDNRITKFSGGFQSISGLNLSVTPNPYREGGFNTTAHQIPGMTNLQPVTFNRGALFGNDQAITWMRGLFAVTAGEGLDLGVTQSAAAKNFRCNVKIYVMDHPNTDSEVNTPRMGFIIRNAWPTNLNFTDLNAQENGLMFETMTLVHEGISAFYTNTDRTPADSTYQLSGV